MVKYYEVMNVGWALVCAAMAIVLLGSCGWEAYKLTFARAFRRRAASLALKKQGLTPPFVCHPDPRAPLIERTLPNGSCLRLKRLPTHYAMTVIPQEAGGSPVLYGFRLNHGSFAMFTAMTWQGDKEPLGHFVRIPRLGDDDAIEFLFDDETQPGAVKEGENDESN